MRRKLIYFDQRAAKDFFREVTGHFFQDVEIE